MFVTSKTQAERFVGKWQIDNFGAILYRKQILNEKGNWIVFIFKEK